MQAWPLIPNFGVEAMAQKACGALGIAFPEQAKEFAHRGIALGVIAVVERTRTQQIGCAVVDVEGLRIERVAVPRRIFGHVVGVETLEQSLVVVEVAGYGATADRLVAAATMVLVERTIEEVDRAGVAHRVADKLAVGVADALRLAVVATLEQLQLPRHAVHHEVVLGQAERVERVVAAVLAGGLLDNPILALVVHAVARHEAVGLVLLEHRHKVDEGLRVEPVVGIEQTEVATRSHLQRRIDGRAVVSVGLIDHNHRLRIAVAVGIGNLERAILATVVHDDDLQLVDHLLGEQAIHATTQVGLHVVGGNTET